MRKTLIGLAAVLALSGAAVAGEYSDQATYLMSPGGEFAAPKLDHPMPRSINAKRADQQQAPAPVSSRHAFGDSAAGVVLPVGNAY